jgi:hypothetical protein
VLVRGTPVPAGTRVDDGDGLLHDVLAGGDRGHAIRRREDGEPGRVQATLDPPVTPRSSSVPLMSSAFSLDPRLHEPS